MKRDDIRQFLYPKTVAVIGASEDSSKFGGRVLEYLLKFGFPGTLVNVRFGGLMGFTMAYDLAVTRAGGVSYMLSYIHMAGAEDPAAERALRSLCPGGEIPRTQSSAR